MPTGQFHPTVIARSYRDLNPGKFDDIDDSTLIDALKDIDPATYQLIDPQLIGAELLPEPPAPQPQGPHPIYHPPPSRMDTVAQTALRLGGGFLGGLAGGAVTSPSIMGIPAGVLAGTGTGMAAGEVAAQKYADYMGIGPPDIDWTSVGVQGALGLVPMGEVAGMGRVGATAVRAGQSGLLGTAGTLAEDVTHGRRPTAEEVMTSFATGAVLGGGLHGAGEVYAGVRDAAPAFRPEEMGLPTGAPPVNPLDQSARVADMMADAHRLEAQEISKDFAKRGWEIPPSQRGTLAYGQQAKAYLETIAGLVEEEGVPPMMPPVGPVPPTPPPQKLLPSSPILAYGPEGPPPSDFVVPGTPQRGVQAQPTIDRLGDQLVASQTGLEGPPRLRTEKQLQLTNEVPGPPIAAATPLLPGGTPPGRPQSRIQKGATPDQPYLPGATQPAPLDRQYATGPNAGPRRERELHGQPRTVGRRVDIPGTDKYRMETVPTTRMAEDPGTYPAEVRREMARMLYEMVEHPHERVGGGITRQMIDDLVRSNAARDASEAIVILKKSGATSGGAIPGAPVFRNILDAAEGARAHAQRADVIKDLRAALLEGKGSHLSDAAAEVARQRIAQEERGGLTPEGYKAGSFQTKTGSRIEGYPIISRKGAGDDLIGWIDEAGNKALPDQDLSPEQLEAREMSVEEIRAVLNIQKAGLAPEESAAFFQAVQDEAVRKGLIRPEQMDLTMEGPGGAGGPKLSDFEGEEPPRGPRDAFSEHKAATRSVPQGVEDQLASLERMLTNEPLDPDAQASTHDLMGQYNELTRQSASFTPTQRERMKRLSLVLADRMRQLAALPVHERLAALKRGGPPPAKPAVTKPIESQKTLLPTQQAAIDDLERELVDRYGEDMSQWPEHLRQGGTFKEQGPIHWGTPPELPPEAQPTLPGTAAVRETDLPTPPIAEAPFALTPPPTKPEFGSKESAQRSLFDRLKDDVGSIAIPRKLAGDRVGFKKWLADQEQEHGEELWFNRAEEALVAGDHDRAWKIASAAAVRSFAKASAAASTPQEEEALRRAVKGTVLQADIQTQIVGQARRKGIPKEDRAPAVEDFPPSAAVSQAGAARGRATLGPAGIINPGPPQRPLEGKYTDFTLSRTLQKTLIESTDPKLLHLIPGNTDTNLRLYRQIADLAFQGVNTRELKQYLKLSNEEIAQHFLRAPVEAARTLQQLSAFRQVHQKTLDRAAEAMSFGGALEGMIGVGEGEPPLIVGARGRVIGHVGQIERERTLEALAEETRSFDQIMLTNTLQKPVKQSEMELLQAASYPFMISQIATAERNALVQAGRYGMDTLDEALTIPLAKGYELVTGNRGPLEMAKASTQYRLAAVGRPGAYVTPRRSWKATVQDIYDISAETLSNMSPEDARATLKMLTEFPTEGAHFLGWASSAGEFEGAKGPSSSTLVNWALNPKVQRWLTVFNRAQEFTGRALVYDATMRSQIAARGLSPSEVLQLPTPEIANAVGGLSILDDMVHVAVASSLEATFAGRAARNSIPGALLRFVNQAGFLKLGYPFPKFNLSAAPRYIWDHGPWALMDLVRFPLDAVGLSPSEFFVPGAKGRLYRGVRAEKYRRVNIPEAIGKRQLAEIKLSATVRELASTRRELTVRQNMVKRLERKAQAGLPGVQTTLDQAIELRDQLARRAERVRGEVDTHEGTIRDLRAQEESLLDDVYDAEGIRAPNLPQYFARIGVGTFGNLAAAFVIRSMPGAQGTKWYQYQMEDPRSWVDGKPRDPVTLDFRPLAPYAQYLFVADVMRDFELHTDWGKVKADMAENAGPLDWTASMWQHYTGKYTGQELGGQFAEAFLSMSRAAGTTLTILDLMKANGWPSPTDAADAIIGTIGQFMSRFTVPARTPKDILGQFLPEEAKARIVPRATAEEPFRPLAAPLGNVPFLSRVIPERISQTTGEPVATEFPLLRALAGIGATPKDFITEEVQRVGVPGQSVFIRETGDYPLDRVIAETYNRILEKRLPRELERPYYRRLGTPADQRDYLQRIAFPAFKREAVGRVKQVMGYERVEASTVRGEAARRKQRRLDLLDRLQGELGPAPPDDTAAGDQPPGPPQLVPPAGFGPPPAGP